MQAPPSGTVFYCIRLFMGNPCMILFAKLGIIMRGSCPVFKTEAMPL